MELMELAGDVGHSVKTSSGQKCTWVTLLPKIHVLVYVIFTVSLYKMYIYFQFILFDNDTTG